MPLTSSDNILTTADPLPAAQKAAVSTCPTSPTLPACIPQQLAASNHLIARLLALIKATLRTTQASSAGGTSTPAVPLLCTATLASRTAGKQSNRPA